MDSYEKQQLKYKHILTTFILLCVTVVITACATYYYYGTQNTSPRKSFIYAKDFISENPTSDETISSISNSLKTFRYIIDEYYKGDIDEKKLFEGTIKGYVDGLGDQYSEYMTAEDWENFQQVALGNYDGIGIYMSLNKDNNIVVVRTMKDSPGEKAGLKADDIIAEVDGESILGITDSSIATSKIKGPAGTNVHLKVVRAGKELDFDIERASIKIYHAESKMLENNIGYIDLITFDEGCSTEVKEAIEDLKSKGAKKLILDLRSNTGGLVSEALEIANFFIENGKGIVITENAQGERTTTTTQNDGVTDMELVLLVNEYTASASEILAGALRDNGKAKLVGVNTYGKGVIQSVFPLYDGSVLKLTVAEYYTPNETKIHKIGLKPDYEVELPTVEKEEDFIDTQLDKAKSVLNGEVQ